MVIKDFFKEDIKVKGFTIVDVVTLCYMAFTTGIICFYGPSMEHFTEMLLTRGGVMVAIGLLFALRWKFPSQFTKMFSDVCIMCALVFWYQEVYYFSSQLPYKDHIFAAMDWKLFGCQPSIEFCEHVTSTFWYEAFNCGYYSYYYMMLVTVFFIGLFRYKDLDKAEFIYLTSFFLYYIIYEFLPVAGPYYYFHAIGIEAANSGVYPDLGHFFQTNHDMMHAEIRGIFSQLVHDTQEFGELPAAAFPSSHCGMTTVCMILAWKTRNRWLFWLMMPLAILLCLATVYIRAHYLVDSIAGIAFAFLFYYLTSWLYDKLRGKNHNL